MVPNMPHPLIDKVDWPAALSKWLAAAASAEWLAAASPPQWFLSIARPVARALERLDQPFLFDHRSVGHDPTPDGAGRRKIATAWAI